MENWIVGGTLFTAVILAVRAIWRQHKRGKCTDGCTGCGGCGMMCAETKEKVQKKESSHVESEG